MAGSPVRHVAVLILTLLLASNFVKKEKCGVLGKGENPDYKSKKKLSSSSVPMEDLKQRDSLPGEIPPWALRYYETSDSVVRNIHGFFSGISRRAYDTISWLHENVVDVTTKASIMLNRDVRGFVSLFSGTVKSTRGWVTCVSSWDDVIGVTALQKSLKRVASRYPLIVLVDTKRVTFEHIKPLLNSEQETIVIPVRSLRLHRAYTDTSGPSEFYAYEKCWTLLRAFSLQEFDRLAFLSPHTMVMRNLDDLLSAWGYPPDKLPKNQNKTILALKDRVDLLARPKCLCLKADSSGNFTLRDSCPFKAKDSKCSTPFIESGIMVFTPEITVFQQMHMELLKGQIEFDLSQGVFGFLSEWFKGQWTKLPTYDCPSSHESVCHSSHVFHARYAKIPNNPEASQALVQTIREEIPERMADSDRLDVYREGFRHLRALTFTDIRPWRLSSSDLYSIWKDSQKDDSRFENIEDIKNLSEKRLLERKDHRLIRLYLLWWSLYSIVSVKSRGKRKSKTRFADHVINEYLEIPPSVSRQLLRTVEQIKKDRQSPLTKSVNPPEKVAEWLLQSRHSLKRGRIGLENPAYHQLKRILAPEEIDTEDFWRSHRRSSHLNHKEDVQPQSGSYGPSKLHNLERMEMTSTASMDPAQFGPHSEMSGLETPSVDNDNRRGPPGSDRMSVI